MQQWITIFATREATLVVLCTVLAFIKILFDNAAMLLKLEVDA